jgi:outer membrane protein TolC
MGRTFGIEAPIAARVSASLIMLTAWMFVASPARGQSPASATVTPMSGTVPPKSGTVIPPPKRFAPTDSKVTRIRVGGISSDSGLQTGTGAAPMPTAAPLPDSVRAPDSVGNLDDTGATPAPPPRLPVDTALIPGRVVEPIDLANALKLTGARELDIAIARQRILAAAAELMQARALWLPSLFYGPTWYRSDGQIQTVTGQVQTINRSAVFVGGTAALANTIQGPPPGTGIPSVNGMTTVLRISDAVFLPMAARRVVSSNEAGLRTANNDAMLQVAESYFNLQGATGRLAIAREAAANAEALSTITAAYARLGQGLEADHRRALTEVKRRRRDANLASGQLLVASADLVRLLVLDPKAVVAPVEPSESIIRLVPDDIPLNELLNQGMRDRPELATAEYQIQAAFIRRKQARLRPFIPSVTLTYAGGGLGGGAGSFFGDFGGRGDVEVGLFWELQNLGFTDVAIMRHRAIELNIANLQKIQTQTQVGADVVAAFETRQAAARQIEDARETLVEAIDSLRLNFLNIRQGAELPRATRPIEVLQPIQALAQGRLDYLDSVLSYNRAQFRLKRAIGQAP